MDGLKGNWRDLFQGVRFCFDPKKVFVQVGGLGIAIIVMAIFLLLGIGVSGLEGLDFFTTLDITQFSPWGMVISVIGVILGFFIYFITNGMVSRFAAVNILKDESIGMSTAVKFGFKNIRALIFSPISLLIFIFFIALFLFIGGLIGRIPYIGQLIVSFSPILVFIFGLLILFLTLVLLFGLVLLPPIIAVEEDDTISALGDLFSLVTSHFWRLIGYEILVIIIYLLLTVAVIGIGALTFIAGGIPVLLGMGERLNEILSFSSDASFFIRLCGIIIWISIILISLYVICIPKVYANVANTIIYCNLEKKVKLKKEEKKEGEESQGGTTE
ncbi:MAG: hypothetical protein QME40_07305 [bacterium]|nr:hypothetical protein [bacterium]